MMHVTILLCIVAVQQEIIVCFAMSPSLRHPARQITKIILVI